MRRVLLLAALVVLPALAAPIGPDRRGATVPDRNFDAEHLLLALDIQPDARRVSGTATWTLRRLTPGPFVVDQVALEIGSVTADGAAVPYRVEGDLLSIDAPGDHPVVTITYAATPENGLHWREVGPDSPDTYAEVWSQGEGPDNRYWFPGYDHPNDRFTYEGRFTAPPGWKVLTNAPGTDLVNYLVMVAAGPYDVHGDDAVSVWVPPGTPEAEWRPALDPIPAMMKHFAERTGVPYPWGPYRQVFVQRFLYSGMENTSATVEARRLLVPPESRATRPWNRSVFAHELAHQWYGDLLTCRDWRELWLNEGFTTFLEGDWTASVDGPDAGARQVRRWFTSSTATQSLAGRYSQGPSPAPSGNVYNKGASVLTMLRVQLGEEVFWRGLRTYTQRHQRGVVHTRDFQVAMEDVSGRSLDWFFQQWVELPYVPTVTSRWTWREGELVVTLSQKMPDDAPPYTLPIDLEVGVTGAPPVTRSVWMADGTVEVRIPLATAPRYVAIDPKGGLLANLDATQDPDAWIRQLDSPSPYARLLAIHALGKTDRVEPLRTRLDDPATPLAVRLASAEALGEQRAAEPLLARLADAEPRVRLAVATALSDASLPAHGAELARRLGAEANPDVRAALLRALAVADAARAVRAARERLVRASDEGEASAAATVLGDHGDATDLPRLLRHPQPRDVRLTGLRSAARIADRVDDGRPRKETMARVARSAELLLTGLDLRERQSAVRILGDVGDKNSVIRLEAAKRATRIPAYAELIANSLQEILGRDTPAPAAPNAEEARLKALEARLDAIEAKTKDADERH